MSRKYPQPKASRPRSVPKPERPAKRDGGESPFATRRRRAVILLVIALVSGLLYVNTIPNALVYDDLELIPKNPVIHNPWDLRAIFAGSYWGPVRTGALYRPLTVWSLALNDRANVLFGRPGEHPSSFHLMNLLLHAVVGCLLYCYLLQLQLPVWPSLATTLLFAVHPIHTEAVSGVVGRAEVLAALLGLLFLILHRQRRLMVVCALVYLLALWSKESAIAFFPLAIGMDMLFRVPARRLPLSAYGVYALTMGVWFSLRTLALGDMPRPIPFVDNPLTAVSPVQQVLTAARVQLDYLRLQLVPVGLSSDYSYNQIPIVSSALDPHVLGFVAVLLAAIGITWVARRKHPVVPFAVLGYALLFSSTSNFLLPIGTIMGERLVYVPSIFVCLLLGYGAWRLRQVIGHPTVMVAPAVLVVLYAALTVERNRTWSDELTFFQAQVHSAPHSAKAHYNFGTALAKTGDDRAAVQEYEAALGIFPYYSEPCYNMGNALRRLGTVSEKVIEAYRNAIRFDPGHRDARANLAFVLCDLGRTDEARPLVEELAQLDPQHPSLATFRLRLGMEKGTTAARGATTALPDDLQKGVTLYVSGNHSGAIQHLEQALAAGVIPAPMRRTTLMMLSRAYEATGKPERAAAYRKQVEALGPTQSAIHN